MLYAKRSKFKSVNEKIGDSFSKLPLSANHWTALSILFAIVSAYFIAVQSFAIGAIFLALMAFADVIDGAVARATRSATSKGAYFDTIADRYTEFIIIAGLFFVFANIWLLLYLFGSMMTTYAKAAAKEKMNKDVSGGLLERGERMILLFAGIAAATFSQIYLAYFIIVLAVLSNVTALQRLAAARE